MEQSMDVLSESVIVRRHATDSLNLWILVAKTRFWNRKETKLRGGASGMPEQAIDIGLPDPTGIFIMK
jgi:hypothetical protein